MDLLDSEDSAGTSGDEVPQEPRGGNGRDSSGLSQQDRQCHKNFVIKLLYFVSSKHCRDVAVTAW